MEDRVLAAISVVIQPMIRYTRRDFFLIRDFADIIGNIILSAKRQWETTQEKIRISQKLINLTPFVPGSVRHMVQFRGQFIYLSC